MKHIKSIHFEDNSPGTGPDTPNPHMTYGLRINGKPSELRALLNLGWSITGKGAQGTVVSFVVLAEDCHVGAMVEDDDGKVSYDKHLLGGMECLTPRDAAWEELTLFDAPDKPSVRAVRVYLHVEEVGAIPRQRDTMGNGVAPSRGEKAQSGG